MNDATPTTPPSAPAQRPVRCYRIFMHGQNFLLDVDGGLSRLGFYVTRYLRAYDEAGAQDAAFSMIYRDLAQYVRNDPNNPEDEPVVDVEEWEELADFNAVTDPLPPLEWYEMDNAPSGDAAPDEGPSGFSRL